MKIIQGGVPGANDDVENGLMALRKFNMPFVDFEELEFNHFNAGEEISWVSMVSGDYTEIWFLAPTDVTLDRGEFFQIEVEELNFGTDIGSLEGTATWTSSVPEPGTLGLLAAGLLALSFARRKRTA